MPAAAPNSLTRFPDWESRLGAYIEGRSSAQFAWGVHDCAQFALGAVIATVGFAPVRMRPFSTLQYRTGAQAYRALRRLHFASLLEVALFALNQRETHLVSHSRRGDLVWMPDGAGAEAFHGMGTLGVSWSDGVLFPTKEGLAAFGVVRLDRAGAVTIRVGD